MERFRVNGNQIKLFACFSMLIDHIGLNFFRGTPWYYYFRVFGRMAFPLYLFLLTEGALHTRDRKKYLGRLLLFALLSEIPFNLGSRGKVFAPEKQNVFWTLALVLVCIYVLEWAVRNGYRPLYLTGAGTVVALALAAAELMHTDYRSIGVASGIAVYVLYRYCPLNVIFSVFILCLSVWWEIAAIAAVLPAAVCYDGTRGKEGKWTKWAFYAFYPLHLLALWWIRQRVMGA